MDCDKAFAVLVAGPFPRGLVIDEAVESHLSSCPSCAAIAEALRPTPELVHESLSTRERAALPGYHGSVGCPALLPGLACSTSNRISFAPTPPQSIDTRPAPPKPATVPPPAARRVSWFRAAVAIGTVGVAMAATGGLAW